MTKSLTISKSNMNIIFVVLGIVALFYFIRKSSMGAPVTQFNNAETWEWVDWKGRDRQITVHRDAKIT